MDQVPTALDTVTEPSGVALSAPDRRDVRFRTTAAMIARNTAFATVLLKHPIPPRQQGLVAPCCVSIAIATCMEVLDARTGGTVELSPLFHYYVARPAPGALTELSLREGFARAAIVGICPRALHDPPFDAIGAQQPPSAEAIAAARARRIAFDTVRKRWEYRRIPDANRIEHWREALRRGMPVAIAFRLTPEYGRIDSEEAVHPPVSASPMTAAHAVVVIGFDNDREQFIVKDSRGELFGIQGTWWLPYAMAAGLLVIESWTVERLTYDD